MGLIFVLPLVRTSEKFSVTYAKGPWDLCCVSH